MLGKLIAYIALGLAAVVMYVIGHLFIYNKDNKKEDDE